MRAVHYTQLLAFTGMLLVTACASGTPDKTPAVEVTQASQPDALQPWTPPAQSPEGVDPFKRTEPLPQTPPLPDNVPQPGAASYADMALAQTNGSVRIFSLDDPAPQQPAQSAAASPSMAPLHPMDNTVMTGSIEKTSLDPSGGTSAAMPVPVPQQPQSAPSALDPSVMVYSLDEAAPRPRQQPQPVSPYPSGWMPGNELPESPRESFGMVDSREPVAKIYFRNGSADLTPLMQNLVEQLASDAKSGRMITIEGHASRRASTKDPVEARIINLKISMQRALAVSQELIRKGIPAPNIKTTARGDNQPPQTLEQGMSIESASRRVEIFRD